MTITINGKQFTMTTEERHVLEVEEACSRLVEVEEFELYQAQAIFEEFSK